MRLPDGSGERWAVDERGGTGRARPAGDDLRQRLDRLAACHPSSPDYLQTSPDYEETSRDYEETSLGHRETEYDAAGAGAEPAMDEQDRQAARGGEPARRGEKPAGGLGPGRPAGWRTGAAAHRPDGGAAGGLAGRPEPYRPWFTAGESPEPWFTGEYGG